MTDYDPRYLCDHKARARIEWVPVDTFGPEEDWQFELVLMCSECGWSDIAPISWRSQTEELKIYGPGGAR